MLSRPQRKSLRLKAFDYSNEGYYFVTICTHHKEHILARVWDGKSKETKAGEIVQLCWERLDISFPTLKQDAFIVMPNHIHAILNLTVTGVHSLSTIIQNLKSISSRRINNIRKTPGEAVWQRNFFERVIRTERELNLTRLYIKLNPMLWDLNKELSDLEMNEQKLADLLAEFSPNS
jgi:REP element-mobilizing transposase RayT